MNPVTGEVIEAYNLLSVKGFVKMLVTAQGNFTGVSALGMVLVCMMGVSLCEQSGLFRVALKGTVENSRGSDLKVMVIFFICCVLADCAGGAGWVVLPPLGAMICLCYYGECVLRQYTGDVYGYCQLKLYTDSN